LQARFEIRRDRTLSLTYSNIQVTEVRGKDLTIGLGYKLKGIKLPFATVKKKGGGNDLNLRADFNLRDNNTILRKLVENTNQASAGNETVTIKFTADYNLTERFNVSAYFDRTSNSPFVSSSYPTAFTTAGIRLRFTLAQ
jgi:cell surface protein SprA